MGLHTAEVMNIGLCEPEKPLAVVQNHSILSSLHRVVLQFRLPQWWGVAGLFHRSVSLCYARVFAVFAYDDDELSLGHELVTCPLNLLLM